MIAAHFSFEECTAYWWAAVPYTNTAAGSAIDPGGIGVTTPGDDTSRFFEKFGVKRIQGNVSPEEVAVMAKTRKVVEAVDYKGLTFRGDGYGPLCLQEPEFQASGVMLATGDVYTALQTGVIDACEMGNAFSNYGNGLQEITKYWSLPGMQQLCQNHSQIFNLDLYNKLSPDLQEILQAVTATYALRNWAFSWVESAKIIPILQTKWGITVVRLSDDCQRTWKTVGWRLADAYGAKNKDFGTMWSSMKDFMGLMQGYSQWTAFIR